MKESQRGGNRKGAGRKKKLEGQKPKVSMTLSKEVLDNFDTAANALDISRSRLIDILGNKGVAWLVMTTRVEMDNEVCDRTIKRGDL